MKQFFFVFIALMTITETLSAQTRWNSQYQAYVDRYKDIAIEQMKKHKIPASITLAQGLLESGAGKSELTQRSNNHFGIKCHNWTGPRTYKDDDEKNDCFRVYSNARESFEDHSQFLLRPRYSPLFTLSITDYKGWARGLKACGYATNPRYASHLIEIIEVYNLHQYDKATKYDHYMAQHAGANTSGHMPTHTIYFYNENYYVMAHKGDTFKSISREVGVSARKLAKYNERDKNDILEEGDVVYLEKKKKKALKVYKKKPHIVRDGESMYSIAQLYGIRLKSLYKKNGLTVDYMPKVGDVLKVY